MKSEKYKFDSSSLDPRLRSTRPINSQWADLNAHEGSLRLQSGAALTSVSQQSLIGLPIVDMHVISATRVEFSPTHRLQSAGLVSFFENGYWQYLQLSSIENQKHLVINTCSSYEVVEHFKLALDPLVGAVELKLSIESDKVLFYYSNIKHQWHMIGQTLKIDRSKINDQSILGICCVDHFGKSCHADFEFLNYQRY